MKLESAVYPPIPYYQHLLLLLWFACLRVLFRDHERNTRTRVPRDAKKTIQNAHQAGRLSPLQAGAAACG